MHNTSQVVWGTTTSKDRACHLNSNLANMKFVLFQSCSEFLTIIQSLSSVLHYDDVTIDGAV